MTEASGEDVDKHAAPARTAPFKGQWSVMGPPLIQFGGMGIGERTADCTSLEFSAASKRTK